MPQWCSQCNQRMAPTGDFRQEDYEEACYSNACSGNPAPDSDDYYKGPFRCDNQSCPEYKDDRD